MKTFAIIACILLAGCSARIAGNYCLVGRGGISKSLVFLDPNGTFQERCWEFECRGQHSFGLWQLVGRDTVELSSCSDSFGFEITQIYKSKTNADSLINIMAWYPGGHQGPVSWSPYFKAEDYRALLHWEFEGDWHNWPDSLFPIIDIKDSTFFFAHFDSILFTAYRKSNGFDSIVLYRDRHMPRYVTLGTPLPDTVIVMIDGPREWYNIPTHRYRLDHRQGLMMPVEKTEAQIREERQYWVNIDGDSMNTWSRVLELAKEAHGSKKVFFKPVDIYCKPSQNQ